MTNYCANCGKKADDLSYCSISSLCKECLKKRIDFNKMEEKKEKLRKKKIEGLIAREFNANGKILELEKVLGKPCMLEIHVANEGVFLFGRFVKRKFVVKSISKDKKIMLLNGEYKDIGCFCKKARKTGFKAEAWDSTVSLAYKGKKYQFLTDGIYEDIGRAGAFARVIGSKAADVKYALWGG